MPQLGDHLAAADGERAELGRFNAGGDVLRWA